MNTIQTMRVGFTGFFYPVPPEIDPNDKTEWLINHSAELGCTCIHLSTLPNDPEKRKQIRELAAEKDVEIELIASGLFGLTGPDGESARANLQNSIAAAREVGCRILRTGYGRLTVETSRFNRQLSIEQHLERLAANLRLAEPMIQDNGLLLGIENHCDFTGAEMARLFDMVGSPVIGAALDTANGYTVFCDPNEDVQVLAPYAVTTHLKDMRVVDFGNPRLIPMMPEGCALGQGHVDIAKAVRTLAEKSPLANGLHLIIELGWVPIPEGRQSSEVMRETFDESVTYLRRLVQTLAVA
jgi:3-oxoisoapionate decarboxylase